MCQIRPGGSHILHTAGVAVNPEYSIVYSQLSSTVLTPTRLCCARPCTTVAMSITIFVVTKTPWPKDCVYLIALFKVED